MVSTEGMDRELSGHVRYAARTSKKLARKMFHAMVKHGPKLEREQMLLARFCANARLRIEEAFRGVANNTDRMGYRLAQSILGDSSAFLHEGIVHEDLEEDDSEAVVAEVPVREL